MRVHVTNIMSLLQNMSYCKLWIYVFASFPNTVQNFTIAISDSLLHVFMAFFDNY